MCCILGKYTQYYLTLFEAIVYNRISYREHYLILFRLLFNVFRYGEYFVLSVC